MSEITKGTVTVNICVLGDIALRIYQQAGIPIAPHQMASACDVPQLMYEWHQRLNTTYQTLAASCRSASLARGKALAQCLADTPMLRMATDHLASDNVTQARSLLQLAEKEAQLGSSLIADTKAREAQARLEEAVAHTYERLCSARQQVFSGIIGGTLQEMGYKVVMLSNEQGSAIWATQGDRSLAVVLNRDGTVQMDTYGFSGLQCKLERDKLTDRLEQKGIRLQVKQSVLHGDRHGGQLVKNALASARQQKISVPDALLQTTAPRNAWDDLRRRQQIVWGQRVAH